MPDKRGGGLSLSDAFEQGQRSERGVSAGMLGALGRQVQSKGGAHSALEEREWSGGRSGDGSCSPQGPGEQSALASHQGGGQSPRLLPLSFSLLPPAWTCSPQQPSTSGSLFLELSSPPTAHAQCHFLRTAFPTLTSLRLGPVHLLLRPWSIRTCWMNGWTSA